MLILTRRPVESVYIGDEITVTVLGVVGNQVRFGIEAPRNISIDRAEIRERKRRQQLRDAGGDVNGNVAEPSPPPRRPEPMPPRAPEPPIERMPEPDIPNKPQPQLDRGTEEREILRRAGLSPDSQESRRKREGLW